VVANCLAFERAVVCIVDHALHDQFAVGAGREQPEHLAHLRDLPDAGQLDGIAFDGGADIDTKLPAAGITASG
jgi:hypothetical protein